MEEWVPYLGQAKYENAIYSIRKQETVQILICICEKGKNMVKDVSMSQTEDRLCIFKKNIESNSKRLIVMEF